MCGASGLWIIYARGERVVGYFPICYCCCEIKESLMAKQTNYVFDHQSWSAFRMHYPGMWHRDPAMVTEYVCDGDVSALSQHRKSPKPVQPSTPKLPWPTTLGPGVAKYQVREKKVFFQRGSARTVHPHLRCTMFYEPGARRHRPHQCKQQRCEARGVHSQGSPRDGVCESGQRVAGSCVRRGLATTASRTHDTSDRVRPGRSTPLAAAQAVVLSHEEL